MRTRRALPITASIAVLALSACGDRSSLPPRADFGPNPTLPPPKETMIPTVNIAPAKGWPDGGAPKPAEGLKVNAFAKNLDHPRWLHVLPNGDVLVAETNKPKKEGIGGPREWIMSLVMKRAGAGVPSANRITLLRDADQDGTAEIQSVFLEGLNSPFGMALVGDKLYVANTDALVRFDYQPGQTKITAPAEKVVDLPAGEINHHWTKNVIANKDGSRLYVTSGSNSNVGENGMENEVNRAAILEVDPAQKTLRLFASGLRNPNGLDWNPESGELWTAVNERDEIGSDLVPDYITSVKDGGFYGWPYSYFGQNVDTRPKPPKPELVAKAISPDYAMGAHTASMSIAFYDAKLLPERFHQGAFVGQHGSWNRKPLSGYQVAFVPFKEGKPAGPIEPVLNGFVNEKGDAFGRPVGVVVDRAGALLVADDVGNVVWRVTPEQVPAKQK